MAAHTDLPFAGRITHFLSNWEVITQDTWVLQTIQGFGIEFLQELKQSHRPSQLTFTQKEELYMEEEILGMISKQANLEIWNNPEGYFS